MVTIGIIKALGDENRLRILNLLFCQELCVCEMEGILSMTQSNISRHLSKLTATGVTKYRKEAKYIYYRLDEETMKKHPFLAEVVVDLRDEEIYKHDLNILKEYMTHGYTCDNIKDKIVLFMNS